MSNTLLRNVKGWPELTNTERELAIILGSYPEGKFPSNRELARKTGFNESTVQKAVRTLRKKDMI